MLEKSPMVCLLHCLSFPIPHVAFVLASNGFVAVPEHCSFCIPRWLYLRREVHE